MAIGGVPKKCKHSYDEDDPGYNSWLSKSFYDEKSKQLTLRDPDHNSLWIKNNEVRSILEFMKDRLLIHVSPTDLLIAIDWKVVQRIIDSDKGNIQKF